LWTGCEGGSQVRVEARADAADESARAGAAVELAHRCDFDVRGDADQRLDAPGGIERSIGKAKRIVDLRKK
jgi:phenylacetate-CoA ligase